MAEDVNTDNSRPQLKVRRVNLDTGRENVAIMSRRSKALRPEVFRGFSRIEVRHNSKVLLATLIITDDDTLVGPDDLGLAEPAFRRFAEPAGSKVTVTPAASPASLDAVRAKIQGRTSEPPRDRRHRQRPCPLSLFRHGNRGVPDRLRELSDQR